MTNIADDRPQNRSRREFIRKVLLTTAYAAPAIVSLSLSNNARADGTTLKTKSPGSPMRMMSPTTMTKRGMGNPGNLWK